MNMTSDMRQLEEDARNFHASLRDTFPAMRGVVSLGDYTRQAMKEENRKRRIAALHKQAIKRMRAS